PCTHRLFRTTPSHEQRLCRTALRLARCLPAQHFARTAPFPHDAFSRTAPFPQGALPHKFLPRTAPFFSLHLFPQDMQTVPTTQNPLYFRKGDGRSTPQFTDVTEGSRMQGRPAAPASAGGQKKR